MTTPRHPLLTALALGALLTPLSAQQDWVQWTDVAGVNPSDQFGTAIVGLGDLNADGYDDYAVSSVGSDRMAQNAGLVTIFSGFDDSILDEIDGLAAADQLGFSMAFLGSHNGDNLPKLAIGAPYASTVNGPFTGLVRIYSWDNIAGSMSLNTELLGPTPGALFGFSLAAYEMDGDNDLDLAVGAMGTNFQDGEVLTYTMSSAGAATPAADIYTGSTGSMEMLGWSLARGGIPGGAAIGGSGSTAETLIAGAPFADDIAANAGAAVVLDEFGNQTLLSNPLAAVADAHLGYSVAGGFNAAGGASNDYAAGAPDTTNGAVVVWNGSSLSPIMQINGQGAGSQFGYSVLMIPDSNFDSYGDLAVGSPGALGQRGAFNVFSVANVNALGLYDQTGPAGTTGNFGWSLGVVGDLNQTDKAEIGVGSPHRGNDVGAVDIFAPPAQDIGPIALTLAGAFEWETDVERTVTNLSPGGGGEIYWYVGTTLAQTTSPHGYDLNIGGLIDFSIDANPGDTAQSLYRILDTLPDGTDLYFQVIEDRNGFVRNSNTATGTVSDPGVTLFVIGNTAGQPITLKTRWGIPNSPVYIYGTNRGFTPGAVNVVPNGGWKINLVNPRFLGQPGDKSGDIGTADEGVFTSSPINVPAGFAGVTAHFQAYDWDLFVPALTRVVAVTFQ
ncbi:MAG: integrin alpha [Planctomycetota bacterium]